MGASSEALDQLQLSLDDEEVVQVGEDKPSRADYNATPDQKPKANPNVSYCPIACHIMKTFSRRAKNEESTAASSKHLAKMSTRKPNMFPGVLWSTRLSARA